MKMTTYTIWTLVIAGLLPPFLGVTFLGIQVGGGVTLGFYSTILMIAYLCAGIPSVLFFVALHRYGKGLLHQSPPLRRITEWLLRTIVVATLLSLVFPTTMIAIQAYLSRGFSVNEAFVAARTWLFPSIATGVTVGLLLGIMWKRISDGRGRITTDA